MEFLVFLLTESTSNTLAPAVGLLLYIIYVVRLLLETRQIL